MAALQALVTRTAYVRTSIPILAKRGDGSRQDFIDLTAKNGQCSPLLLANFPVFCRLEPSFFWKRGQMALQKIDFWEIFTVLFCLHLLACHVLCDCEMAKYLTEFIPESYANWRFRKLIFARYSQIGPDFIHRLICLYGCEWPNT